MGDKTKKKKTGCLIGAVVLVLFFGGLIFGVTQMVKNPEKYGAVSNPNKSDNKDIQSIIDATGMALENATEAYNAFRSVSDNISVIYTITPDSTLDNLPADNTKGYRIKTEFSNNVILYVRDGKIYSLRYADYDYYINGKVNGYFYDRNGKLIAGQ